MGGSTNREDMHRQVGWMVAADVSILEFLYAARDSRGRPSVQTPRTIHANTGYSRQHASRRCQVLADYGLVDQEGEGLYRLSEYGVDVMDNQISLGELDDLEPDGEED